MVILRSVGRVRVLQFGGVLPVLVRCCPLRGVIGLWLRCMHSRTVPDLSKRRNDAPSSLADVQFVTSGSQANQCRNETACGLLLSQMAGFGLQCWSVHEDSGERQISSCSAARR